VGTIFIIERHKAQTISSLTQLSLYFVSVSGPFYFSIIVSNSMQTSFVTSVLITRYVSYMAYVIYFFNVCLWNVPWTHTHNYILIVALIVIVMTTIIIP